AVSGWNPWLPQNVRELSSNGALLPTFVMFWVVSSLLDLIGSTEERVRWQTRTIVGLSALRAVALSAAAVLTRQLEPVLLTLLGFAIFKFALLLTYVARYHGLKGPFLRRRAFTRQLRQTAPFALTGALYGLRAQADQWVATALFSVGMFASFSIAALLSPLVHLCRVSVQQAFLPSSSRREAPGDLRGMLELNSRGSVLAATLLYPVLVFAFVFSAEIVTIIYTSAYVAAAPVMRIYILGLIALVIEPATLMLLLRQGAFSMRLGVLALALSVTLSWTCASAGGLAGAAVGSVTAIYLEHVGALWRISRCTGIPWRHLQDWRSLRLLLVCAALARVISWVLVRGVPAGVGPDARGRPACAAAPARRRDDVQSRGVPLPRPQGTRPPCDGGGAHPARGAACGERLCADVRDTRSRLVAATSAADPDLSLDELTRPQAGGSAARLPAVDVGGGGLHRVRIRKPAALLPASCSAVTPQHGDPQRHRHAAFSGPPQRARAAHVAYRARLRGYRLRDRDHRGAAAREEPHPAHRSHRAAAPGRPPRERIADRRRPDAGRGRSARALARCRARSDRHRLPRGRQAVPRGLRCGVPLQPDDRGVVARGHRGHGHGQAAGAFAGRRSHGADRAGAQRTAVRAGRYRRTGGMSVAAHGP